MPRRHIHARPVGSTIAQTRVRMKDRALERRRERDRGLAPRDHRAGERPLAVLDIHGGSGGDVHDPHADLALDRTRDVRSVHRLLYHGRLHRRGRAPVHDHRERVAVEERRRHVDDHAIVGGVGDANEAAEQRREDLDGRSRREPGEFERAGTRHRRSGEDRIDVIGRQQHMRRNERRLAEHAAQALADGDLVAGDDVETREVDGLHRVGRHEREEDVVRKHAHDPDFRRRHEPADLDAFGPAAEIGSDGRWPGRGRRDDVREVSGLLHETGRIGARPDAKPFAFRERRLDARPDLAGERAPRGLDVVALHHQPAADRQTARDDDALAGVQRIDVRRLEDLGDGLGERLGGRRGDGCAAAARVGVDANDFVDTERPRQLDVRALAGAATLADDRAGAIRDRDGRAVDESLHRDDRAASDERREDHRRGLPDDRLDLDGVRVRRPQTRIGVADLTRADRCACGERDARREGIRLVGPGRHAKRDGRAAVGLDEDGRASKLSLQSYGSAALRQRTDNGWRSELHEPALREAGAPVAWGATESVDETGAWVKRSAEPRRARSFVVDPQFARDISEPRVSRPQCRVRHKSRREEVRIDPSDATPVQSALASELDDLAVRHDGRLVHERVVRKKLLAAALIANQKFTVHKVVAADLAAAKQLVKLASERRPVGQEANPD